MTIDPDVEDNHRKHPDRDTIRWAAVGEVVQKCATKLMNQDYTPVEDEEPNAFNLFLPDNFSLTPEEHNIVQSWFWGGEMLRNDPWCDTNSNGRHRLWNVWKASPHLILPIYSELLRMEDEIPFMNEEFARDLPVNAKAGTLKVPADAPVRARSTAYFKQLESYAAKLPETSEDDFENHPVTYESPEEEAPEPVEREPAGSPASQQYEPESAVPQRAPQERAFQHDKPRTKFAGWIKRLFG
ncbi:hypothetical protein [Arthrobacter sp. 31Y]|uniref:hypothetical protein n=1 Tax=Arthrobacter sp. 31Y TaxID=1115632 RepID=UPI00163B5011|nr:hypothetical protein [Arthrobacter sp. 31Y]